MNVLSRLRLDEMRKEFFLRAKKQKSSEQMTRIILAGSFAANILITLLLIYSIFVLDNNHAVERLFIAALIFCYLLAVAFFTRNERPKLGAWMLIALYGATGITILLTWGINAPIGILILGFVIILTSVMLGSRHIPAITAFVIAALALLQYLNLAGISAPDSSNLGSASSFGDVMGYSTIFAIFAIISWISGRKTEDTLKRAIAAENELQQERDALAQRVEDQTMKIKAAQQKELKQLYKFAELGQLTTIILHELANYLSVLTLDIEDLKERRENSVAIKNAKESIFYIDSIIDQVRNQIKTSDNSRIFDSLQVVRESIDQFKKKSSTTNLRLYIQEDSRNLFYVYGDPLRLTQAINILVTNAVQAAAKNDPDIEISVGVVGRKISLSVKDFGKGISFDNRRTLFQPQKSTKGAGLGIGLYITKQIIETHFKGVISLSPVAEYTEFVIELPVHRNTKTRMNHGRNAHNAPSPHKSAASNPKPQ